MEDKFLTLAIHTPGHAMALSRLLENHGLKVRLQKLVMTDTPITMGVRVRIRESDLPLALKIT